LKTLSFLINKPATMLVFYALRKVCATSGCFAQYSDLLDI